MIGEIRPWNEIFGMCEELPDDDLIKLVVSLLTEIPAVRASDLILKLPDDWANELRMELHP